jgi:carbon storage regulator
MLVLSRRRDQSIVIFDERDPGNILAEVTVVDIRGDKVRLGLAGNEKMTYHRREVYDEVYPELAHRRAGDSGARPHLQPSL